ncbi:hypothetical protein KKF61_08320, partial [Patescibacteria group bacterium]|nr:hypothetical protein [Patescibacteria group bacterium]
MATIIDALIVPTTFYAGEQITAQYTVVGGTEIAFKVHWYKNSRKVVEYDDLKTITVEDTVRGDTWFFLVVVLDEIGWSATVQSLIGTTVNKPPTLPVSVIIIPQHPLELVDHLTVFAEGGDDPDGDKVSYSYYWYRNEEEQLAYRNKTIVASTSLYMDDTWKVQVYAQDPYEVTSGYVEDEVTILRDVPRRDSMVRNLSDYFSTSPDTGFYTLLRSYADVLEDIDDEVEATRSDLSIDASRGARLASIFGDLATTQRQTTWSCDDYRFMLKVLLEALSQYTTTTWGVEQVGRVAVDVAPFLLEHYKYAGWILGSNALGIGVLVLPGSDDLTLVEDDGHDYLGVYTDGVGCLLVGGSGVIDSYDQTSITDLSVVGVTEDLRAIEGSGNYVWIVGSSGRILRKFPTDVSFITVASPVVADLNAVDVWSETSACAVGASGTIIHYNGVSWST